MKITKRSGGVILCLVLIAAVLAGKTNDHTLTDDPEDAVQETQKRGDSEKEEPNTGSDAASNRKPEVDAAQTNEMEVDAAEVYERFLDGKCKAAWKKKHASIGELFWDNDIEYCFYDIDGDGSEELHIRDSVAYYAVKVCGQTPQILFDGWWGYEPLVVDGQCGILHYYQGYGHEGIEFMTVDAEGGRESGGEFYWSDDNKNGDMDQNDYFRGLAGWEEIDMERYVRYRDEQLKKLDGNELEWKGRELEAFATWQEAYTAYIERRAFDVMNPEYVNYALIYVDDDEIPELYIFTGGMVTGEFVVSYYNGHMGVMNRERVGLRYVEHGSLLYSESGNMGFSPCNIYRLDQGGFVEIGTGWSNEIYDGETIDFDYFWEGRPVTEAAYEAHIEGLIDRSACVEPTELYTKEEILEILEDYKESQ